MRQATRQNSLGAPYVATDTVCTLPDHRCHDKRRWQRVTSSEATLLVRPQALLRWHTATLLFRTVFWVLPYPLLSAYHRPYKPNHPSIGLFRALNWRPRKADGCSLSRDMYDTPCAQASLHTHRVAHSEAVRQDAAQPGRVPRACGYRTCPEPPARRPSVGQHTRKAGVPPLMLSSWPPSERPGAVPYHTDLLDATCATLGGRGHGSTRSYTTSRRIQRCDTLSNQYARGGDGAARVRRALQRAPHSTLLGGMPHRRWSHPQEARPCRSA